MLALIVR